MSEHTPTPSVGRAFYGFTVYLFGWAFILCYICWALVPHWYLQAIGITYLPQPYWALALPSFIVVMLLVFVFFIYPAINFRLTVPTNDLRSLKDKYTVDKNSYAETLDQCSVSPIFDLSISSVCENLYER